MHKKNINDNIIGERLKAAREFLGYKKRQGEFAEKLGTIQNTYSNYENGHREIPFKILEKISQNGINLNWLFTGSGDMYLQNSENKLNINDEIQQIINGLTKSPSLKTFMHKFITQQCDISTIEGFCLGLKTSIELKNV